MLGSQPSARVITERCGWKRASASVEAALLDEVGHERVVARDAAGAEPLCSRYARESPTWAIDGLVVVGRGPRSASCPCRGGHVPSFGAFAHGGLVCLSRRPLRQARRHRLVRGASIAHPWSSTAIALATSPASCPPMPSATTNSGGATKHAVLVVLAHVADVCQRAANDFGNLELRVVCIAH